MFIASAANGQAKPDTAPTQSDAAPATDAADASETDIIVTAQRREERLQDVPVAVAVLSASTLENRRINSSTELAQLLPGLVNVSNQSSGAFAIRGQGPSFGSAPGTYVYFADVPTLQVPTNTEVSGIDSRAGTFFDMANVQLLKGPQGTLFGRNATGGNVLFTPQRPTDRFEGYVQGLVGKYADIGLEGAVNIPIVPDVLAIRVAGALERRNGYVRDVGPIFRGKDYEDLNHQTGRISVLFTPSPTVEDYFIGRYYRNKTNGVSFALVAVDRDVTNPVNRLFPSLIPNFRAQSDRGPFRVAYDENLYNKTEYYQFINHLNIHLTDNVSLKNIVSYSNTYDSFSLDVDATPLPIVNQTNAFHRQPSAKTYTGELQLAGDFLDKDLQITVGAYGDKATLRNRLFDFAFYPFVPGNLGFPASNRYPLPMSTSGTTKSQAVYGQATLNFGRVAEALRDLRLTGGYRYTWEQNFAQQILAGRGDPGTADFAYGSYNVTVDYKLDRNTLLYASIRDAYKSGGVNAQLAATDPNRLYSPEHLISREIGVKTTQRLPNATFTVDLAGFWGSYQDIQRAVVDSVRAVYGFTTNVAQARIRGAELDASVRTGPVTVGESYAFTDSGYTRITDPAAVATLTGALLPYIPKHKSVTNIALDLFDNPDAGKLTMDSSYAYQSKLAATSTNVPSLLGRYIPGFGVWNAAINWTQPGDGPLSARIFVNNITNKRYIAGTYDFTSSAFVSARYGMPTTFAAQVRYRF